MYKRQEYNFSITAALCDECGEAMAVPGLIDKNIQEIDEQYLSLIHIDVYKRQTLDSDFFVGLFSETKDEAFGKLMEALLNQVLRCV